jgi:hypothetical protein
MKSYSNYSDDIWCNGTWNFLHLSYLNLDSNLYNHDQEHFKACSIIVNLIKYSKSFTRKDLNWFFFLVLKKVKHEEKW